jgi:zinc/manganese transport system substrate-binding protein
MVHTGTKGLAMKWIAFVTILLGANLAQAKVDVVASLPDYAALAKAVGGDHVSVKTLAVRGEDPHFVDARPAFVMSLNRADLVVVNGGELEIGWMKTLLVQARNGKIQPGQPGHLDVGSVVKGILDIPQGAVDRSMGDVHPGGNPHYYYDPKRMLDVVNTLAKRLKIIDAAHSQAYEANRLRVYEALQVLIRDYQAKFSALQPKQKRVVEYHKSFSYLFETLGIQVVSYVENKPGVAPSPAHVASLAKQMKSERVGVVVQESHFPTRLTTTLVSITKGRLVILNDGTDFEKGQTYLEHVRYNFDLLFKACQMSEF